ncbi:hypothetical protein ACVWXU_003403 [Streptomyces sp. TE33382]
MRGTEGGPVMTPAQRQSVCPPPDSAYLSYLGHTLACSTCRSGTRCATAIRLGRAWRAACR